VLQQVCAHHPAQEVGDLISSFSQWFVSYQKKPAIKQVTWVCGSESVLVDDVVETIRSNFGTDPWCFSSFTAGTDSDREIWADLDQHPIDGRTPRLVVVHSAEKLADLGRISEWMATKNKNPLTSVVFISNQPELAREELTREMKRDRTKPTLKPHLAAIQGRGSLVECKAFTQATAKHAVAWVQSKVAIRPGVAGKLLERANGDLRLTRDAVVKLSAFPDEISEQTINLLLSARPRLSFVDALLELDKRAALLALEYMDPSEYSGALGLLDQRIDVIGRVRDMLVSHASTAQISSALGTMGFLTRDLVPLAKAYDQKRRQQLRDLLARTDEALKGGVTVGPLEVLVHFW
jgi:DNA polymerase III delta subunit